MLHTYQHRSSRSTFRFVAVLELDPQETKDQLLSSVYYVVYITIGTTESTKIV